MNKCKCGKDAESPSGSCKSCMKVAASRFWEVIESYRHARLEWERRSKSLSSGESDSSLN
jgi:hypothetical protein